MRIPEVDGIPFRSKEISWLAFNSRVLQEAADPAVPLGERLRFLGIYSSNLDEFFRVRMATLRRLVQLGTSAKKLGLPDPKLTLREAKTTIRRETGIFDATYRDILRGMEKHGVSLVNEKQVPEELREWLYDYFFDRVRPRIVPVMVRSWTRLSSLRDQPMYLAVEMTKAGRRTHPAHALIEIPADLPRFVTLPEHEGRTLVMYLDDIIRFGLPGLFTGLPYDIFHAWAVKFTRDSELEYDDDFTQSVYERISEGLRARQSGQAVRMNYDSGIPKSYLRLLMKKLRLADDDTVLPGGRYHNRKDLMRFPVPKPLNWPAHRQLPHWVLSGDRESIFRVLQEQDVLLHLPWHSFSHFLDFLREAAIDPLVHSISMTQYRVARNSCVARALCTAAQNGKEVTVLVEPQARFDEKNNMDSAALYQEAGVRVILGVPGVKVHAKLCMVVRRESAGDRRYCALSTGNFNEDTATFYTDHMLMTSNPGIGQDVANLFSFFDKNWQPPRLTHLVCAPFNLRASVRFWIQNEIANARQKKPSGIFLKMNNLADPEITALLYEARDAGVEVRLLVRSMFSVITSGDTGKKKGIRAAGIVDRFLEHSRIFLFTNAGSPRCYLSSADFLPRNFDSRVESVFPVLDETLKSHLTDYMDIQWRDNVKARVLDRKLTNVIAKHSGAKVRAQEEIGTWLAGPLAAEEI